MRNLKRALSLGLTAAMISGLMVMGSSAASYADVTSENNVEAIEVLEAVGIMIGDENGNFNPDQNVTRNEMAVVMANLMEYNVASYKDTSPFTDVPSWAEPYVAACWTNGITAGYSSTIYGGSDTVTTAQAALMLMKALGYFQYASDFGGDWQLATTRQGNNIDLFVGVDSGVTQAMTRNDVAQLVLNTLKSGTVEASTDGSWTIGDVTINNNVTYSYITSNQDYADAIDDVKSTSNTTDANRFVVELGEQLYMGDLQLNDEAVDAFGRPARYWEYDSEEIGTYVQTELLRETYTTKVTGRDLYNLLGSSVIDSYDFNIAIDGETDEDVLDGYYFTEGNLVRSNTNGVGGTGDGVLTEVYVDVIDKEVTIAIINTYLAITDDYDEDDDEIALEIYAIEDKGNDTYVKTMGETETNVEITGEDFDIADYVDGDIVLVTVADGEVQTVADPEIMDGVTITTFRTDEDEDVASGVDYVISDGTQYDAAYILQYDETVLDQYTDGDSTINLKDITYNLILDPYGNLIGLEQNEDPNQYLFVTGFEKNDSYLGARTASANVIFTDGTMATVDVNVRDSEDADGDAFGNDAVVNTWCTYTVNSSDVYTLHEVANDDADDDAGQSHYYDKESDTEFFAEINDTHVSLPGKDENNKGFSRVYGNDDSVYINVEVTGLTVDNEKFIIIDDVDTVTTGIENTDLQVYTNSEVKKDTKYTEAVDGRISSGVYTLYDDDAYVIAAVVVGEDVGTSTDYAYVTSSSVTNETYLGNDEWSWSREVVINGQLTEITYVGDQLDEIGVKGDQEDIMEQGHWYEVRYDADGNVRRADLIDDETTPTGYRESVIAAVEAIEDGVRTVLLETTSADDDDVDELTLKSRMLYTNTDESRGFGVTEDVNVVLIQRTDNGWYDIIEEYTGVDGLEDAIDDMNDNFTGKLAAVIEDGRATSIIIHNTNPVKIDEGNSSSDKYEVTRADVYQDAVTGESHLYIVINDGQTETALSDVSIELQSYISGDWKTHSSYTDQTAIGLTDDRKDWKFEVNIPGTVGEYRAVVTIDGETLTSNTFMVP